MGTGPRRLAGRQPDKGIEPAEFETNRPIMLGRDEDGCKLDRC